MVSVKCEISFEGEFCFELRQDQLRVERVDHIRTRYFIYIDTSLRFYLRNEVVGSTLVLVHMFIRVTL